ncbi:hypothetical protein HDE_07466 [Halotydeus destructor]|nr:hypothetical protein HDE_07466 [Halotydeus destructor]
MQTSMYFTAVLYFSLVASFACLNQVEISSFTKHGHKEYMSLRAHIEHHWMSKSYCADFCRDYGATIVEPRTEEEETFIRSRFEYAWLNVFFGQTETSSLSTWRFGSDGEPVENVRWSKWSGCDRIPQVKEDSAIYMMSDGWCVAYTHELIDTCACQK